MDATKGALVALMVAYHSLNYSADYRLGFKYFPFLPPSFILITGFLISHLYTVRRTSTGWNTNKRLLVRGFKLLVIFTVLNCAAQFLGGAKLNGRPTGIGYFFDHWFEIYVTGGSGTAAFEVLLPISYLLLVSPLLLALERLNRFLLPLLTIGTVCLCAVLEMEDSSSQNFGLSTAGAVGMLIGRVPIEKLNRLTRYWVALLFCYGGYLAVAYLVGQGYLTQLTGACFALALVYSISVQWGRGGVGQRGLIVLGKYSLISYILQIGILQLLLRVTGRLNPFSIPFWLQLASVLLVLIFIVEAFQWMRKRCGPIDTVYQGLFA